MFRLVIYFFSSMLPQNPILNEQKTWHLRVLAGLIAIWQDKKAGRNMITHTKLETTPNIPKHTLYVCEVIVFLYTHSEKDSKCKEPPAYSYKERMYTKRAENSW